MTRPKQNPRTFRGASNLELEVDLAPKNTTVENEREIRAALPGRRGIHRTPEALHPIWKVSSRGLPRPPLRNPACHQYSSVPDSIALLSFFSGDLDPLIGCPGAEVTFPQDLRALFRRVLREVSQPGQPFGVGNPSIFSDPRR